MSYSYCLCVHNEGRDYLERCLFHIKACMTPDDELVIVDDYSTNPDTVKVLEELSKTITIYKHALNGNFAEHKNYLLSLAKKDYIWLFDADEYIEFDRMRVVLNIVAAHPQVECFLIPRKNILPGVTDELATKMNWNIKNGLFNFPDFQPRIFKNTGNVKFSGNLHEWPSGYNNSAMIPVELNIAIMHIKSVERQLAQHNFYETIKRT